MTLNSALHAAFALALDEALRGGRGGAFRTFTIAGLRPHLVPPLDDAPLGAPWAMLRYVGAIGRDRDLWRLARSLQERFRQGFARGDKFSGYRATEPMMRILLAGKMLRMGEVAVSYTGVAPLGGSYGELRLAGLHAFVSTMDVGPLWVAQARMRGERLGIDAVYLDTDMDRERAAALAARACELLQREPAAEAG